MIELCGNCNHRQTCDNKGSDDSPCKFDESHWTSDTPEEEFFIVAARRRDGGIPAITKGMGEKMYHTVDDAVNEVDRLMKPLPGVGIGVFRVLARVVQEVKP